MKVLSFLFSVYSLIDQHFFGMELLTVPYCIDILHVSKHLHGMTLDAELHSLPFLNNLKVFI